MSSLLGSLESPTELDVGVVLSTDKKASWTPSKKKKKVWLDESPSGLFGFSRESKESICALTIPKLELVRAWLDVAEPMS